jgi:hypothetical protein
LFLDELWVEFERIKNNANKLKEFHQRLRALTFFDPACGCGNFLVIAYRELRHLELAILRAVNDGPGSRFLNIHTEIKLDVDQFYGIEIEEFPAQIAQVALWLTDHQMNRQISDEFGAYFARIPLISTPHIRHENALRIDWNEVLPAERCSYVFGNPPFVGKSDQSESQKQDADQTLSFIKSAGVLDFVAAWYVKATQYIKPPFSQVGERWSDTHTLVRCAFVSTNSITQGEQVGVLWSWLIAQGIRIHFAHRTFRWTNEASGKAAVHCVIVGFGLHEHGPKVIYDYDDVRGEPHAVPAVRINPYLIDYEDLLVIAREHPICDVPPMVYGSKPTDDGNLLLTDDEKRELLLAEPHAVALIRPFMSNKEYLYGIPRWCIWLKDASPAAIKSSPLILERVQRVRDFRLKSKKAKTREQAATPALFTEIRQPNSEYLLIPIHTSENRSHVPFGYFGADAIVANSCSAVANATIVQFGILNSLMHMAWMRYTCGRIKSDFRYSNTLVYNNFPWPESALTSAAPSPQPSPARGGGSPTSKTPGLALDVDMRRVESAAEKTKVHTKLRAVIEQAAQVVLDARAAHPESSLADLYDPLTMPPNLVKAHQKLDAAVDAAYYADHVEQGAKKTWKSDAERVAFLFALHQKYTSLFPAESDKSAKPRRAKKAISTVP